MLDWQMCQIRFPLEIKRLFIWSLSLSTSCSNSYKEFDAQRLPSLISPICIFHNLSLKFKDFTAVSLVVDFAVRMLDIRCQDITYPYYFTKLILCMYTWQVLLPFLLHFSKFKRQVNDIMDWNVGKFIFINILRHRFVSVSLNLCRLYCVSYFYDIWWFIMYIW